MSFDARRAAVAISASTTTASSALPASSDNFIRVVNPTTALCYVNSGGSGVAATNANQAVGAYSTEVFQIGETDTHVAVLLSTGTGTVSVSKCANQTV